ncbi:hypothetical protein LIER_43603 [Lithospermum erythrorhizon]|uniref:Uncharacterized protein n=1 Tax=Lithospermum erythrorhizon TaxID=34254 RepID=A0AAV3QJI5_LITER
MTYDACMLIFEILYGREFQVQKMADEGTINKLQIDLSVHRNHIESLSRKLDKVYADTETKYYYEIQGLKDCLLVEQEEKNDLNKKFQELEKELLISRSRLAEHQQDTTSSRHVETLKQKIMKMRKENEVLRRQLDCLKVG